MLLRINRMPVRWYRFSMSVVLPTLAPRVALASLGVTVACFNPPPHALGETSSESEGREVESQTVSDASEDAPRSESAADETTEPLGTTAVASSDGPTGSNSATVTTDVPTSTEPWTGTSTTTADVTSHADPPSTDVTDSSAASTCWGGAPECSEGESGEVMPTPRGGPYVVNGERHGSTFVQVAPSTTTVSTDRLDAREIGEPLCINGTLDAPNLLNYVRLGVNLAQPEVDDEAASVPLTGSGLALDVTLDAPPEVGLYSMIYADPAGTTLWCSPLYPPGRVFLEYSAYSEFFCFGGGELYDPATPVTSIVFMVESMGDEPADFELCIFGFGEGDSIADARLDE